MRIGLFQKKNCTAPRDRFFLKLTPLEFQRLLLYPPEIFPWKSTFFLQFLVYPPWHSNNFTLLEFSIDILNRRLQLFSEKVVHLVVKILCYDHVMSLKIFPFSFFFHNTTYIWVQKGSKIRPLQRPNLIDFLIPRSYQRNPSKHTTSF